MPPNDWEDAFRFQHFYTLWEADRKRKEEEKKAMDRAEAQRVAKYNQAARNQQGVNANSNRRRNR